MGKMEQATGVFERERLRFRIADCWCSRVGSRSDWVGGASLERETSAEDWAQGLAI